MKLLANFDVSAMKSEWPMHSKFYLLTNDSFFCSTFIYCASIFRICH